MPCCTLSKEKTEHSMESHRLSSRRHFSLAYGVVTSTCFQRVLPHARSKLLHSCSSDCSVGEQALSLILHGSHFSVCRPVQGRSRREFHSGVQGGVANRFTLLTHCEKVIRFLYWLLRDINFSSMSLYPLSRVVNNDLLLRHKILPSRSAHLWTHPALPLPPPPRLHLRAKHPKGITRGSCQRKTCKRTSTTTPAPCKTMRVSPIVTASSVQDDTSS